MSRECSIMSVQVYGCNHVAIEVGDIKKAVEFYQDLFGLEKLDECEGDAFFKLGEHQFLAMFERKNMRADASDRHFGIMVRDANQVTEVRDKITKKYKIELIPPFGCDFCDPWGNRIHCWGQARSAPRSVPARTADNRPPSDSPSWPRGRRIATAARLSSGYRLRSCPLARRIASPAR